VSGALPRAKVVHSTFASHVGVAFWAALVVALIAIPYWGDRQMMRLLTEIYSFVALASLWNLLAGYAGLVSVGQQAFVGLGGYTLYLCALWAGLNPLLGLPLAGVIGGVISIPIVVLLLKLRGAYFTIGSWVVAEVFLQIFQLVPAVGGGSGGRSLDRQIAQHARVGHLLDISRASGRSDRGYRHFVAYTLWLGAAGDPRQ
jgi:branched-chain amino acid transport system permease protein